MKKQLVWLLLLLFIFTACVKEDGDLTNDNQKDVMDNGENNPGDQDNDDEEKDEELTEEEKLDKEVEQILEKMTLEEKVGQMFMLAFRNDSEGKSIQIMTDTMNQKIKDYHIGGVILFKENINNPRQTFTFIQDMQEASTHPLFIGVDEEGGLVSRIGNNPEMHATTLPDMKVIGDTGQKQNASYTGEILGKELKSLGFNLDFAPVADVNTNPNNPVIGVRSFGNDPELVAEMVEAEVIAMQQEGVSACLKHFPGHGDTGFDSHNGRVSVPHDIDRMKSIEWVPFEAGIGAGVDFVMVGHINTPNLTQNDIPASLSKEIMDGFLRNDLGFRGLIITDALEMKAISDHYSSSEASIMAVKAGVDILLMPENFEEAFQGVLEAVKSGDISEERITESVRRILKTKYNRGLFNENKQPDNYEQVLGNERHIQIIEEIKTYK